MFWNPYRFQYLLTKMMIWIISNRLAPDRQTTLKQRRINADATS